MRSLAISPDYLKDTDSREVNLYDYGLQLSRSWRALKVWFSVRFFGLDAFRAAIDRGIALARHAERRDRVEPRLRASLARLAGRRLLPPALPRPVRRELELAGLNAQLNAAINASGTGFLTSTRLRGKYALRLCILNHTTTQADVDAVLDFLERAEPELPADDAPLPLGRELAVRESRLRRGTLDADVLLDVPVLASLDDDGRAAIIEIARELEIAPGETVVEQWDSSRDFYIVLEGLVEVVDGETGLAELRPPGDHFGEIAALDWASSFGYARTASVVARQPTRLLVVPFPHLNEIGLRFPAVEQRLRQAANERLQHLAR